MHQRFENNDWNLLEKLKFDNETLNLLKLYRKFKDTLTINLENVFFFFFFFFYQNFFFFSDNDIILTDNCIVLPEIFHKTPVKLTHTGHQGIQKTKALMRIKFFFLGMDNAIENEITTGLPCQATG